MNPPLKILFLIRSLNFGGAERQLATLVKNLKPTEFTPAILVFYDGGPIAEELLAAGFKVISLQKTGRWDVARFAWRMAREARRLQPDIIYSFMDLPNLCALGLRLLGRSRLVWGVRVAELELQNRDWLIRRGFSLAAHYSKRADLVICNSQAGRDFHLRHGYPADKTIVISNGIDTGRFTIARATGQLLRRNWGVRDNEKLVGLVARLDPIKDHPLFLQAAARVVAQQPDTRFICVGEGPTDYLRKLQNQAEELGLFDRLIWEKGRQDLPAVYNALDTLALSSAGEGFPNVVAEAMACGVPCVVTDVGDAAHIVGNLCRVVPPKDAEAFAQALLQVIHQTPDPFALRARITENFSAESLSRNTAAALFKLCES